MSVVCILFWDSTVSVAVYSTETVIFLYVDRFRFDAILFDSFVW